MSKHKVGILNQVKHRNPRPVKRSGRDLEWRYEGFSTDPVVPTLVGQIDGLGQINRLKDIYLGDTTSDPSPFDKEFSESIRKILDEAGSTGPDVITPALEYTFAAPETSTIRYQSLDGWFAPASEVPTQLVQPSDDLSYNTIMGMIQELRDLVGAPPEDEEGVSVTPETSAALQDLLIGLVRCRDWECPVGVVGADDFGGVDITWRTGSRVLILAARKKSSGPDVFIYERDTANPPAKGYSDYRGVDSHLLQQRLDWLFNN